VQAHASRAGRHVSNATRHNIAGGRIEVATRTEAEHAVLSVANTGRLLPAGELTRLFQPFQRLGPQPQARADGVGLGLAIVQAIADAHDAIVTAHARAGGGLKIDVRFPATMNTAGARSVEQPRATSSPRRALLGAELRSQMPIDSRTPNIRFAPPRTWTSFMTSSMPSWAFWTASAGEPFAHAIDRPDSVRSVD